MSCKICWMLKATDKSKCLCSAKPFNEKKFEAKKPIAQISEKKKQRLEDSWTEVQLFNQRYQMLRKDNKHQCVITWSNICEDDLTPACFAHLMAKWMYPKLRYNLNNIWLVKWIDEHKILDEIIVLIKNDIGTIELEKIIQSWQDIFFNWLFNKYKSLYDNKNM